MNNQSNSVYKNLINNVLVETYSQDEVIFQSGWLSNGFIYLVVEGEVVVKKDDIDPNFSLFIRKGEFFGELAILNNIPRQATILAYSNIVRVLAIKGKDFFNSMKLNPTMMKKLTESTLSRYNKSAEYYVQINPELNEWTLNNAEINLCRQKNFEVLEKIHTPNTIVSKENNIIFRETDLCRDFFYIIEKGKVAIERYEEKSKKYITIMIVEAGDIIGEQLFIGKEFRVDRARSISEKVNLKIIHKSSFEQLMNLYYEYYYNFLKCLTWKLYFVEQKLRIIKSKAV